MKVFVFILFALACAFGQAYVGPQAAISNYRPINGTGNNLVNVNDGETFANLIRVAPGAFEAGQVPRGGLNSTLANARAISTVVHAFDPLLAAQVMTPPSADQLSTLFPFFGQFLDHDLGLTMDGVMAQAESFPVEIEAGDPFFDALGNGQMEIEVMRLEFNPIVNGNVRDYPNRITGFIDASNVYGSTEFRASALRGQFLTMTGSGTTPGGGLLAFCADLNATARVPCTGNVVGDNTFLPVNVIGDVAPFEISNAGDPIGVNAQSVSFIAGDVRVNENVFLGIHHTVWAREHNRLVAEIATVFTNLTDEESYQEARRWNVALKQHVVFDEWLPVLLGLQAPAFTYNANTRPGAFVDGTHGVFRLGHSMITATIPRRDATNGSNADLDLNTAFFQAASATTATGLTPAILGASQTSAQEIDTFVVDELRNMLFVSATANLDLIAINIQRGRDVGLPGYNAFRQAYGLGNIADFNDGVFAAGIGARLAMEYASPDECDIFTCGLAEVHSPFAQVGPTFQEVLRQMYYDRLRGGDRFYWEGSAIGFVAAQTDSIRNTVYRDILTRNSLAPATGNNQIQCFAFGSRDNCPPGSGSLVPNTNTDDVHVVFTHVIKASGDPNFNVGWPIGYAATAGGEDDDITFGGSGSTGQTIELEVGTEYSFLSSHNCGSRSAIFDSNGNAVSGLAAADSAFDDDYGCDGRIFTWTPSATGTFSYGSRFHDSMGGEITVIPDQDDSSAASTLRPWF